MSQQELFGLRKMISLSDHGHLILLAICSLCLIPAFTAWFVNRVRSEEQPYLPQGRPYPPHGCKRIGLAGKSNLDDEFTVDCVHDQSEDSPWTVKSLLIYPVKSCKAVELDSGVVIGTGMEYDRYFTFAELKGADKSAPKWEFISQRKFPSMALVKTELWIPDPASPTYSLDLPEVQSQGVIVARFPYQPDGAESTGQEPEKTFHIPFNPTAKQIKRNKWFMEEMKIWNDIPEALNMTTILPPELKDVLGVQNPIGLFRVSNGHLRKVFRCAPRKEEVGYQPVTGFADAYPLHLMNLASNRDVAGRVNDSLPQLSVLRFRPNIIITGPQAYEEDSWKRIRIGGYEYYVACRTARCLLPNTNQTTGEKHPKEPYTTLRSYRRIDEGAPNHHCLGMQMVPALERSEIRVGDKVEVLETGDHFYLKQ